MQSIFDTYRTMPEVIYPLPELGLPGEYNYGEMTLSIGKSGGGMLGERYDGNWYVEVAHKGEIVFSEDSLYSAFPLSHLTAALLAAEMFARVLTDDGDDKYPWGTRFAEWVDNFTAGGDE